MTTQLVEGLAIGVSLIIALIARELVKARVAVRLGDPTPARFGRTTLRDPRSWADPVGTVIIPVLAVIVTMAGNPLLVLPFAYAKPMPLDPMMLRRARAGIWISVAGPASNLALAFLAGLALRLPVGDWGIVLATEFLYINLVMCVFHLLPIPGLDGSALLVRVLPPRAAEVYRNLDQYLVLFVLVIFFVLGSPLSQLVLTLAGVLCRVVAGAAACLG